MCAALTVTCCTFQNWDPISLPGIAYPLPTMPTVLWEALCCCMILNCVVRLGLIMSWPSMFLFGSVILHANDPLKNVSSASVLLCKKAAPLHFIQATPQLMLSTLIGNFANKVACFSRMVSHPIAKSHVKPWSVREHNTIWVRLFLPFRTVEIDIKHQWKILTSFFGGPGGMASSASFWLRLWCQAAGAPPPSSVNDELLLTNISEST